MIFHFQTGSVTFFDEDKEYFEKRFSSLEKIFGWEAGDNDSIEAWISIDKNKQHSGDRFEASIKITSPHHGKFHAKTSENNIKKCADSLKNQVKAQIRKFHEKNK